uniref:Uncharacterized protein n=1 Tax=Arundo donax TaxID=35708 RepID=A0A0A9DSZ2_ARUDO
MQAEARLVTAYLYHLVVDGACLLKTTPPWNAKICNDQYVKCGLGRHSALLDHRLEQLPAFLNLAFSPKKICHPRG